MTHVLAKVGVVISRKPSPTGAIWLNVNSQVTLEIDSLTDCDKLLDAVMAVRSELHQRKALQTVGA